MLTTDYILITLLSGNPIPPSDVIKRLTEATCQKCSTEHDFTKVIE